MMLIDEEELVEGMDVLPFVRCVICHGIPVRPKHCKKCHCMSCESCLKKLPKKGPTSDFPFKFKQCPACKHDPEETSAGNWIGMKTMPMNKILKQLSLEKMKFHHKCIRNPKKELTTTEKWQIENPE